MNNNSTTGSFINYAFQPTTSIKEHRKYKDFVDSILFSALCKELACPTKTFLKTSEGNTGKFVSDSIKKVIFNDPCTIVLWKDNTKTVVKCNEGDTYNKEAGLSACIIKKLCGNKGEL